MSAQKGTRRLDPRRALTIIVAVLMIALMAVLSAMLTLAAGPAFASLGCTQPDTVSQAALS